MNFDSNALKKIKKKKREDEMKWRKVYSDGLFRFILVKGILLLALPSSILMTVIMFANNSFSENRSYFELLFFIIFFIFAGIAYSLSVWGMNNRKYIKGKSKK